MSPDPRVHTVVDVRDVVLLPGSDQIARVSHPDHRVPDVVLGLGHSQPNLLLLLRIWHKTLVLLEPGLYSHHSGTSQPT